MNVSILSVSVIGFLQISTLSPVKAGEYWFYAGGVFEYETLSEAETALRSVLGPPGERFRRTGQTIDGSNRQIFLYEVPERLWPKSLGTYSFGCTTQCWYELSELFEHHVAIWESHGSAQYCIVDGPRRSGSWDFHAWANHTYGTSAPPDGADIHLIRHSSIVASRVKRRNEMCVDEPPHAVYATIFRYDALDCPPGYQIESSEVETISPCTSAWKQQIFGPIAQACDPKTGNPCNILTGNKTETDSDYAVDELVFDRTYNSGQMN